MSNSINKHFPINANFQSKSTYRSTIARFEQLLSKRAVQNAQINKANASTQQSVQASGVPFVALSNSGNSAAIIDANLKNTPMAGLGKSFKAAENQTGVNAFLLTAIAIHESAYGKSSIAQSKNNLFGFQAYDDSPFVSAKSYQSASAGIFDVAEYLKTNYLTAGGKYYQGDTISAIAQNYATDPEWAKKVERIMLEISE